MNIIDSPDHNIHYYVLYCLIIIFKYLPIDVLSIYQLLVLSVVCFEIKMYLHIFSINIIVYIMCSHWTLQAIHIYAVKMEINVV